MVCPIIWRAIGTENLGIGRKSLDLGWILQTVRWSEVVLYREKISSAYLGLGLRHLFLQATEQYLTDSQFMAHDFLQVISFLQTTQILLGRELLLPLKEVLISSPRVHLGELGDALHALRSIFGPQR